MPMLTLSTNVSKNLITEEFSDSLCNTLAKSLNKPKGYCAVHIQPGKKSLERKNIQFLIFFFLIINLKLRSNDVVWRNQRAVRVRDRDVDWKARRGREQTTCESDHDRTRENRCLAEPSVHLL